MLDSSLFFIFANIGYVFAALGVYVVYRCMKANVPELYVAGAIIGILQVTAWGYTWENPDSMVVAHAFCLFMAIIFMHGPLAKKYIVIILSMMAADLAGSVYLLFLTDGVNSNQNLFLWRSALNLILAYQCVITINGSTARAIKHYKDEARRHGDFMARNKDSATKPAR